MKGSSPSGWVLFDPLLGDVGEGVTSAKVCLRSEKRYYTQCHHRANGMSTHVVEVRDEDEHPKSE